MRCRNSGDDASPPTPLMSAVRFSRRMCRHLPSFFFVLSLSWACAGDRSVTPDPTAGDDDIVDVDDDALLADAEPHVHRQPRVLRLMTPDGTGQSVHPDFAQMPGWTNPFVIATTPYLSANPGL